MLGVTKWCRKDFSTRGETVHRHVATVVTLLATVIAPDIIQLANRTFRDVPEHIQHSYRYWPHFKVPSKRIWHLELI